MSSLGACDLKLPWLKSLLVASGHSGESAAIGQACPFPGYLCPDLRPPQRLAIIAVLQWTGMSSNGLLASICGAEAAKYRTAMDRNVRMRAFCVHIDHLVVIEVSIGGNFWTGMSSFGLFWSRSFAATESAIYYLSQHDLCCFYLESP